MRSTKNASAAVFILLCALIPGLIGCAASGRGEEQTGATQQGGDLTSSTEAATNSSTSPATSEAVELTGLVEQPATLTVTDLQQLPTETVDVSYETHEGTEQHTYRGVRLYTVIEQAGLKLDSDRKNDQLRKYVAITAKDGYEAVVSWGEIDPDYADASILLAWEEDGETLTGKDGPVRLVVPTDKQGGRYVSGVVRVEVRDAESGAGS